MKPTPARLSSGATSSGDPGLSAPDVTGLLDGMPRQRGTGTRAMPTAVTSDASAKAEKAEKATKATNAAEERLPAVSGPDRGERLSGIAGLRSRRLSAAFAGMPFTFAYGVLLAGTSLIAADADPTVVRALQQASSTDVAHLVQSPVLVLVASALWIAGGLMSPFAVSFLAILGALERRIGGLRTAGVFLLGHMLATLATEVPVGLAVLAGHLPGTSLHRFDYGISFGVATSVGALAGLLARWPRLALLSVFGWIVLQGLIAFTDPMTNWGHLIALSIGVAAWPLVRRWRADRPTR